MTTRLNKRYYYYYYTVFQKSDAKIQITITTAFLKQLLLRNFEVDFVEICNVYAGRMISKAAKRIFNSDKIYRSYSDLNFGVTFFGTQCTTTTTTAAPAWNSLPDSVTAASSVTAVKRQLKTFLVSKFYFHL